MHGLGPTRTRVLSLLQSSSEPLTVGAVADELGLHKNSARFHLDALVTADFAERTTEPSGRTGRPPLLYTATDGSPTIGNTHLLELTNVLLTEFVATSQAGHERAHLAGRAWGKVTATAPPTDVAELKVNLAQRGFGVAEHDDLLTFTRCPFRDVVSPGQLPLVCQIHQGLLEGITDGTTISVGAIDVGERFCHAQLTVAAS